MRTEARDKTAPETISYLRPPVRTPPDDGSLKRRANLDEILKFSVAAARLNLNAA